MEPRDTGGPRERAAGEHLPVMVDEVLNYLDLEKGKVIVDGTVGSGGHAEAIARRISSGGRLIAVDRDQQAILQSKGRLAPLAAQVSYYREDYRDIRPILDDAGIDLVDGVLLDMGVSSLQLDDPERGFSFRGEGPLDMRMDASEGETAADIVNSASEDELTRIMYSYGEERWARRIARFIVESRERKPIETTGELVKVIENAVPAGARRGGKHPARRTFQALRIAVNHELDGLEEAIRSAVFCLAETGRIVVLSYQSLEDRVVKNTFNSLARGPDFLPGPPRPPEPPIVKILTKRPVTPGEEERESNPRSRSAKLRAAERTRY